MTVQVPKTKAETTLLDAFPVVAAGLPGGEWGAALRRKALGTFAALGLPNRRVEEWKYTDLRSILKDVYPLATTNTALTVSSAVQPVLPALSHNVAHLVDGYCAELTSAMAQDAQPLSDALESPPGWLKAAIGGSVSAPSDSVAALNGAYFTDGVVLDIAPGTTVDVPYVIAIASSSPANRAVFIRNVVRVGAGATLTLVEVFSSQAERQTSAVTQLIIEDGASVTHITTVDLGARDVHLGRAEVSLGANATYRPFQLTIGSGLARNDLALEFNGQHSILDFGAAFLMADHGHTDTTLVIDHKVPHCTSRELVKGVLDNAGRGVFQGKVIVRPGAQKTDGKQMAQALMLSPDAEFDSKPELEIYADDVVCGHGSTSAELDEDLLFYLRSRGIPLAEARAMLIESFIGEAIDKVEDQGLREALMGRARRWLGKGHSGQ